MNYGYHKIQLYFRISINRFKNIHKSNYGYQIFIIFKDILKSNYGYPQIRLHFRISIIRFKDILK